MHVTSVGYRTDLALLALAGSEIRDRGDHLLIRSPHNPDFWWGNFLLLGSPPAAQEIQWWLGRFAADFPQATHLAFGVDGAHGVLEDLRPFTDLGCACEAATVLTATDIRRPVGADDTATCRALRSDDDWAQSLDLEIRTFGDDAADPHFRRFAAARTRTNRQLVERGHGSWFGAFRDGRLLCQLGLLDAGAGLARFQTVGTDPAARRQGLAAALVHHAGRWGMAELGARTLVVVADPDYVAIELYRKLGFAAVQTQLRVERPPSPTP